MEHGPSVEDVITPPTAPLGLQIAASAAALGPFTGTSAAAAMPVVEAPLGVMPVVEAMPAINPDPRTFLLAWLHSQPGAIVHPALDLFGVRADGERGVFAMGPIAAGEVLLRLPPSAVLSACEGIGCEWMPEELRRADVSPGVRAALYLLRHSALGPAHSPWAAYFASLPEDIDTVESWSAAELDALRGTAAHDDLARISDPATGAIVGAATYLWTRQLAPLVLRHPTLWPGASLESFVRAWAIVSTRGFWRGAGAAARGPYLLPAMDLLNHSRANPATSLVDDDPAFVMVALRPIAAGEEVRASDAPQSMWSEILGIRPPAL